MHTHMVATPVAPAAPAAALTRRPMQPPLPLPLPFLPPPPPAAAAAVASGPLHAVDAAAAAANHGRVNNATLLHPRVCMGGCGAGG